MKNSKLILISILCIISLNLTSQRNTGYLTFAPTDLGKGLRYDRQIAGNNGIYIAFSKGEYQLSDYSVKHEKAEIGYIRYFKDSFITAGINYHQYENRYLKPFSASIGVGLIFNRVSTILVMDSKWEPLIGIGLKF